MATLIRPPRKNVHGRDTAWLSPVDQSILRQSRAAECTRPQAFNHNPTYLSSTEQLFVENTSGFEYLIKYNLKLHLTIYYIIIRNTIIVLQILNNYITKSQNTTVHLNWSSFRAIRSLWHFSWLKYENELEAQWIVHTFFYFWNHFGKKLYF